MVARGAVRISIGVTIDAPRDVVWDAVEPIERHTEWMADAVSITFTSPQHRGVGTRFDCLTQVGPFRTVDKMIITSWEPQRRMGIEHEGVFRGTGQFTLGRLPNGRTRFVWTERLRFPWWLGGPIGALAATPILRRIWRKNLTRLKRLVESGA